MLKLLNTSFYTTEKKHQSKKRVVMKINLMRIKTEFLKIY